MKLLIADRSRRMRELIKQMGCEPKDEIIECASASALLEACAGGCCPDCVILDEAMAGDDFRGFIHQLRALLRQTRIVVMSLDPSSWFQEMAAEAGASACVPKEDLRQLLQVIHGGSG